ncbi:hypothetical protein ACPOLB_23525 [Rubrivivax sp. RP6-9]|uniref:hypothetical protein n=1 Tax=Rubrivivax sp. RP6-9 TaxID=3415750 RepID=UPI003CC51CF9
MGELSVQAKDHEHVVIGSSLDADYSATCVAAGADEFADLFAGSTGLECVEVRPAEGGQLAEVNLLNTIGVDSLANSLADHARAVTRF